MLCQEDRAVGAKSDERLLADGDETAIPCQRVPHDGEDHEDQKRGQLLGDVRAEQKWDNGKHGDDRHRDQPERDRHPRPALDAEPTRERRGASPNHSARPLRSRMPPRGDASTARKTR